MNTTITSTIKTTVPETLTLHKRRAETLRKLLLICGIVSSVWYSAINIIVPPYFGNYIRVGTGYLTVTD